MDFIALDDWVLFFVAAIANVKIKIANEISTSRVNLFENVQQKIFPIEPNFLRKHIFMYTRVCHLFQTLLEFLVAFAVQTSKEIVIFETIFLFARSDVVAMVVLSTTFVDFGITSQVVIIISRITYMCTKFWRTFHLCTKLST